MTEIRSNPDTIDEVWITELLDEAGVADGSRVTDVEFGGWIGTGQTGANARFRLAWDDPSGRPASLVAKFPSQDPKARTEAFAGATYLKEYLFYTEVAPTIDTRTPVCHFAAFDGAGQDFMLWMEDLSDSEQGDQFEGLDSGRLSLAIEQLVRLHAPRYGEAGLRDCFGPALPVPAPEEIAMGAQMLYGMTLPGFLDRLGDRIEPDIARLAQDFAEKIGAWILAGQDRPSTVIHLDYRADNLLFGTGVDAPPLVVVDWQTSAVGPGGSDLAYLISGSFPDAAERAANEGGFVEEYRNRMAGAGVSVSADDCWLDYRHGSLWGMIITVIATVQAAETERGNDMFIAMAQRHGRQALDLEALSLLG